LGGITVKRTNRPVGTVKARKKRHRVGGKSKTLVISEG